LFYHADIDLLTALAGGAIHIEHLDERWLTVNIAPGDPITPGASPRMFPGCPCRSCKLT
jgi:DnaJ family protein A protein 2